MITNSIQLIINEHLKYMRQHDVNHIVFIYEDKHEIEILLDHYTEIKITEVRDEN